MCWLSKNYVSDNRLNTYSKFIFVNVCFTVISFFGDVRRFWWAFLEWNKGLIKLLQSFAIGTNFVGFSNAAAISLRHNIYQI